MMVDGGGAFFYVFLLFPFFSLPVVVGLVNLNPTVILAGRSRVVARVLIISIGSQNGDRNKISF